MGGGGVGGKTVPNVVKVFSVNNQYSLMQNKVPKQRCVN